MAGLFCVDANIFITAWHDIYPIAIFPSLWDEMARHQTEIIIIKPIYAEIDHISQNDRNKPDAEKRQKYPLRMWLENNGFSETSINNEVEEISLELEKSYETDNNSRGASQQDIKLIAYAKIENKPVVTFEKVQTNTPDKKFNYKIPLICDKEGVDRLTFVEMLESLGVKI